MYTSTSTLQHSLLMLYYAIISVSFFGQHVEMGRIDKVTPFWGSFVLRFYVYLHLQCYIVKKNRVLFDLKWDSLLITSQDRTGQAESEFSMISNPSALFFKVNYQTLSFSDFFFSILLLTCATPESSKVQVPPSSQWIGSLYHVRVNIFA